MFLFTFTFTFKTFDYVPFYFPPINFWNGQRTISKPSNVGSFNAGCRDNDRWEFLIWIEIVCECVMVWVGGRLLWGMSGMYITTILYTHLYYNYFMHTLILQLFYTHTLVLQICNTHTYNHHNCHQISLVENSALADFIVIR